jgi:hypothetical protein
MRRGRHCSLVKRNNHVYNLIKMQGIEVLTCELAGVGRVTVRVRPVAINILVGDEAPSYSFDRAGRLIGAFVGGVNYRRSLDNRVLGKWPDGTGVRQRLWLAADEATAFLDAAYGLAERVAAATRDPGLACLAGWDHAARAADAERFRAIYQPVSILPPDQYLALVLQATEGCSYNRCTFCDFYRGRPFRIKAADELREHVAAVAAFFGPALGLRKSVFLADANALVAPMPRLRGWLDVIADVMASEPGLPHGGIYSFMDAFDVHRKSAADWAELAARGVRRVYIGMETGSDALLHFLAKPGDSRAVIEAVATLKAAQIAASVIVMTGIGGDRFAADHVNRSVAALDSMPLGKGDIIYFSPFVDFPGSEYGRLAAATGTHPLTDAEAAAQEAAIRAGLLAQPREQRPQFSRYDVREFVY